MWAAVPASGGVREGILETPVLTAVEGKQLIVNALTSGDGYVKAELFTKTDDTVSGFGRDQCREIIGDHKYSPLVWKGGEVCPRDGYQLRLILKRARLYGFAWQ